MPMNRLVVCAMLFSASKEMPLVSAASPKMQHIFAAPSLVARRGHAERGGQGGARVARAVAIVLALGAQRETVQAAVERMV